MSYPDYPSNRLIVNGVDLTEEFKMVLVDGYTLSPPEPKTYSVDIPGGHGKLDLTESLFGDTAYDNRTQEFTFYVIDTPNFEEVKTKVSNFLHGRYLDYQITMDPEYTYTGRFKVTSYDHSAFSSGILGCIKIEIDAYPFKHKETQVVSLDAIGGNTFYFESGRKRVKPVFETNNFLKVIYKGVLYKVQSGSWTIPDITFENGSNELYLNSYDIHNLKWNDLVTNSVTWGNFKKKRLYEWYKSNGTDNLTLKTWSEVSGKTWRDLSVSKWGELIKIENSPEVDDVKVSYEWGDL